MAQTANSFATFNSNRVREQLMDKIYNVSVEDTPFLSLIKREKVDGVFVEWLADNFAAGASNKVEQGNQVTVAATTPTDRYGNRTQISEKTFGITGTQEAVEKAGGKSEYNIQLAKKMVELKKDMEFAVLQNTTAIAAAAGVAPQARGMLGWIKTNTDIGATGANPDPLTNTAPTDGTQRALTETLLKNVLQKMFDNGADITGTYAFLPSAQRTIFDTFLAGQTRFDKAEDKELHATLEVYIGPFGRVKAVNARHMRAREVFIVNPEYVSLGMLRNMNDEPLAKKGDAKEYMVNVEYTLLCKNEKAHGAIRDLT